MTEWQPIETDPRDGTEILLLYLGADRPNSVAGAIEGWFFFSQKEIDDGWETIIGSLGDDNQPTHWMPLPEPPNEDA